MTKQIIDNAYERGSVVKPVLVSLYFDVNNNFVTTFSNDSEFVNHEFHHSGHIPQTHIMYFNENLPRVNSYFNALAITYVDSIKLQISTIDMVNHMKDENFLQFLDNNFPIVKFTKIVGIHKGIKPLIEVDYTAYTKYLIEKDNT